jgi:hypothetical protein
MKNRRFSPLFMYLLALIAGVCFVGALAGCSKPTDTVVVNNKVNAVMPAISVHPTGATYTLNVSAGALSVTASVSDGGTLSYQWYSNNTADSSSGIAIENANGSSFTPPTENTGTTYYYCIVSNTIKDNGDKGKKTEGLASSIARITVIEMGAPIIIVQPASGVCYIDNVAGTFSVSAVSTNEGTLSYQWYSSTDSSSATSEDDTKVGSDSAGYIPPSDTIGTFYYYVIISSTKDGVTKYTTSDAVKLEVKDVFSITFSSTQTNGSIQISVNGKPASALSPITSLKDGDNIVVQVRPAFGYALGIEANNLSYTANSVQVDITSSLDFTMPAHNVTAIDAVFVEGGDVAGGTLAITLPALDTSNGATVYAYNADTVPRLIASVNSISASATAQAWQMQLPVGQTASKYRVILPVSDGSSTQSIETDYFIDDSVNNLAFTVYSISANTSGTGSGTVKADKIAGLTGNSFTVMAIPNNGSEFTSFTPTNCTATGSAPGNTGGLQNFTIESGDAVVTADFTQTYVTQTASILAQTNGTGTSATTTGGTVQLNKTSGIDAGETITITATANPTYTLASISYLTDTDGDTNYEDEVLLSLSGSGPWTASYVSPARNTQVKANFVYDNPAAEIGTVKYLSLADALNAGGTVTLLNDVTEDVTIPANTSLDLSGHSITGNISNNGTLSMSGSSQISGTITQNGIFNISDAARVTGGVVSLADTKVITITGALSGAAPVATITPASYPSGSAITVLGESGYTATVADIAKFAVTPEAGPLNWSIGISGGDKFNLIREYMVTCTLNNGLVTITPPATITANSPVTFTINPADSAYWLLTVTPSVSTTAGSPTITFPSAGSYRVDVIVETSGSIFTGWVNLTVVEP